MSGKSSDAKIRRPKPQGIEIQVTLRGKHREIVEERCESHDTTRSDAIKDMILEADAAAKHGMDMIYDQYRIMTAAVIKLVEFLNGGTNPRAREQVKILTDALERVGGLSRDGRTD